MKNSQDRTCVRQNTEYTASRKHAANLRRNPTLHFQIGLILSLLVVIFFMEVKMPETAVKPDRQDYDWEEAVWDEQFQIEKKVVELPEPIQEDPQLPEPQLPDAVTTVDNDYKIIETLIKGDAEVKVDKPMVDPSKIAYEEPVETPAIVPIAFIEEAPIFPGCEDTITNDERRKCMSVKVARLISKKFDTDLGERLGLSGVHNIDVLFTVDATGEVVNIQAKAPHDQLQDEAIRVLSLLPDLTPGKQGDKNIGVSYAQRIKFKIHD